MEFYIHAENIFRNGCISVGVLFKYLLLAFKRG